ncbi:MAG: hypothetical protein Q8L48_05895 [Archangium sp.]|nr:hypothetical protein [Archangium sp.]
MSRSAVLLITTLLFTSCRDEAAEAFARADLQYRALLDQAARPEDARFDAVLSELKKVPATSRHFAAAQKLLRGIEAGRRTQVRTPLALGPNGRRAPALEAQLAACARLAVIAASDGGVDQRALAGLEACRKQAEQLELRFSHPEEYGDGGEHHDE